MRLLSIDIGSYSVKFLEFKIERSKVVLHHAKEVVIDSDEYDVTSEHIVLDLQLKIIREYMAQLPEEVQLILNIPEEISTARILKLPVNKKKKAMLMIPFQLEEDIPFSLPESHIASSIKVEKDHCKALVNISAKEDFTPLFERLRDQGITPKALTSQESVLANVIAGSKEIMPEAFCILDIGHQSTKAYFFYHNELSSFHKSYVAGRNITDAIAQTYSLAHEEATLYKHQNAFLLTQEQFEQVDEKQREFAKLMDKVLQPLVQDFKRWEIGFRVANGIGVSEVLITGSSSNIKNINNYLTEQLKTKTSFLNLYSNDIDASRIDTDEKLRRKFGYSCAQALAFKEKSKLVNFLSGAFSIQGESDLPLRSLTFIGARVAALTLLICAALGLERVFLYQNGQNLERELKALGNNPILELTARQKRIMLTSPETVLSEVKRKEKALNQEITLLSSAMERNAFNSLRQLAQTIDANAAQVLQFQASASDDFTALLKVESKEALDELDKALNLSSIPNLFTDVNEKEMTITVSGSEK